MTGEVRQHCGMGTILVSLFISLALVLMSLPTNAAPQRKTPLPTDAAPLRKDTRCPAKHEIDPCSCRETDALHLTCPSINTKRWFDILKILTEESYLIKTLKITDSDLLKIPEGAFDGLEIEELVIMNSNVSTLEATAFVALKESLKELVLSGNRMKEVPSEALSQLHSLRVLVLSNNKLEQLQDGAFSGMESLQELILEDNDISHVDGLAFKECCSELLVLSMANNLLSTIPSEAFIPLANLSVLRLLDNVFETVDKNAFTGLYELNTLDLSSNHISAIEEGAFSSFSTHSLLLKNNNISKLSDGAFTGLESTIEWLDLSYNEFASVPSEALKPLSALRHLDLSHNKITQLSERVMTSFGEHLRYIELNNNNIHYISPMAFRDLNSVEFLMLGHNNLTGMRNDTVQSILDTVFMLDLSDNPLVCSCELQWLKKWLASVNPLDRLTPDPTCINQETNELLFVGHFVCEDEDTTPSELDNLRMCSDMDCVKSLASFFSNRIWWE